MIIFLIFINTNLYIPRKISGNCFKRDLHLLLYTLYYLFPPQKYFFNVKDIFLKYSFKWTQEKEDREKREDDKACKEAAAKCKYHNY